MSDRMLVSGAEIARTAQRVGISDAQQRITAIAQSLQIPVHQLGGEPVIDVRDAWKILDGIAPGTVQERQSLVRAASINWAKGVPVAALAQRLRVSEADLHGTLQRLGAPTLVSESQARFTRLVPFDIARSLPGGAQAAVEGARAVGGGAPGATSAARGLLGRPALRGAGVIAGLAALGAIAFIPVRNTLEASTTSGVAGSSNLQPAGGGASDSDPQTALTSNQFGPKEPGSRPAAPQQATIDHPILSPDNVATVSGAISKQVEATDGTTVEGKRARIAQRALEAVTEGATTTDKDGALTTPVAAYMAATAGAEAKPDRGWNLDFANWATHDAASMGYDGSGLGDIAALTTWSSEAKAYVTLEQRHAEVGDVVVLDTRGDDFLADTVGVVVGFDGTDLLVAQGDMADDTGAHGARLTRYSTADGRVIGLVDAAKAERLETPKPPPPPPAPKAPTSSGGAYHMGNYAADQLATWAEPDGPSACGIVAGMAFVRAKGGDPAPSDMLELARNYGYSSDSGMASEQIKAMIGEQFGVGVNIQRPPDFEVVKSQLLAGIPVVVATQGHYWVLEGYDPANDTYFVGPTARPFGKWDGNEWLTTEQMRTMAKDEASHTWCTMITLA